MQPERLGPYLLCERLDGHGAEAYRARRVVATGHLSAPMRLETFAGVSSQSAEALVQTAEWGARVTHPGVARVLEVGRHRGTLYAVSELVEGKNLASVLAVSSEQRTSPSVLAALAIGAQLARLGREVHEDTDGADLLGSFRPVDVMLGYDGRVRVRARGVFQPLSGEGRDPFVAPEIPRGVRPGPRADAWTVARVLRAVLATDPDGRKTPKVSPLYKDSLGPILTDALARDPDARLSLMALERRLLDVLLDTADSPTRLIIELLEEQAGGALPADAEPLSYADLERIAVDAGAVDEVLFPVAPGSKKPRPREHAATEVGPAPDLGLADDDDGSMFGRVLQEAERAIFDVSDDGEPATLSGVSGPRVSLVLEDELSLDEVPAAAAPLDAELDLDVDIDMDLDAIARSSLEGAPFSAEAPDRVDDEKSREAALAGTAVVARPAPLPPSQLEEGDVFRSEAPPVRSEVRSSLSQPSPPRRLREETRADPNDGGDVFTATVRPGDYFPELSGASSTKLIRSRSRGASHERSSEPVGAVVSRAEPLGSSPSVAPDPDKTAFLDNPAAAFQSSAQEGTQSATDKRAAQRRASLVPIAHDDDDQATERLSEELIREALRLSPREAARKRAGEDDPGRTNAGPSAWGQPLVSESAPSDPQETALLAVHDVREILEARGGLDAELPEGEHPPTLDEVLPEDLELGLLVIDVPDGAVVFVNGDQRGKGRTVLEQVDLFESFVVRVHHRGHLPWTGTVTLKGMRAARIEPELRRR